MRLVLHKERITTSQQTRENYLNKGGMEPELAVRAGGCFAVVLDAAASHHIPSSGLTGSCDSESRVAGLFDVLSLCRMDALHAAKRQALLS